MRCIKALQFLLFLVVVKNGKALLGWWRKRQNMMVVVVTAMVWPWNGQKNLSWYIEIAGSLTRPMIPPGVDAVGPAVAAAVATATSWCCCCWYETLLGRRICCSMLWPWGIVDRSLKMIFWHFLNIKLNMKSLPGGEVLNMDLVSLSLTHELVIGSLETPVVWK